MKFKKIVAMNYSNNEMSQKHWQNLRQLCKELVFISKSDKYFEETLHKSDALLVKLGATVDKHLISKAPNLKYIGMLGTGCGRIDTELAASKNIAVCNIQDYATESVAELAIGVILEQIREIERGKIQARSQNYSEEFFFEVSELKGKNFGIIGMGNIGTRLAEILKNGFNANVSYWNRAKKDTTNFEYKDLDTLLSESDFISLNLALTETQIKY